MQELEELSRHLIAQLKDSTSSPSPPHSPPISHCCTPPISHPHISPKAVPACASVKSEELSFKCEEDLDELFGSCDVPPESCDVPPEDGGEEDREEVFWSQAAAVVAGSPDSRVTGGTACSAGEISHKRELALKRLKGRRKGRGLDYMGVASQRMPLGSVCDDQT